MGKAGLSICLSNVGLSIRVSLLSSLTPSLLIRMWVCTSTIRTYVYLCRRLMAVCTDSLRAVLAVPSVVYWEGDCSTFPRTLLCGPFLSQSLNNKLFAMTTRNTTTKRESPSVREPHSSEADKRCEYIQVGRYTTITTTSTSIIIIPNTTTTLLVLAQCGLLTYYSRLISIWWRGICCFKLVEDGEEKGNRTRVFVLCTIHVHWRALIDILGVNSRCRSFLISQGELSVPSPPIKRCLLNTKTDTRSACCHFLSPERHTHKEGERHCC